MAHTDGPARATPVVRRTVLQAGLLTAAGAAMTLSPAAVRAAIEPAATYDMFRGAAGRPDDSAFSDTAELLTYPASGIRGGLWVHDGSAGSVENGSDTQPFHRGPADGWGHTVRRVRWRSKRSFGQPMSVLVRGAALWYDPRAGETVDGLRRSTNGGLRVQVGHHSNDFNYVVLLIRRTGHVQVFREYDHVYTLLAQTEYGTPLGQYRTFRVTWSGDRISVYHRYADGSDHLIVRTAAGAAPGVYRGVTYNDNPVGQYLDGAAVRMTSLRVRQG